MRSENTMTVAELIDALRGFPASAEIYIYVPTDKERTPGFDYINSVEKMQRDVVLLSNNGFWPEIYNDPELAGQVVIPEFDDSDASGLLEDY